jgi:hypothetical protein
MTDGTCSTGCGKPASLKGTPLTGVEKNRRSPDAISPDGTGQSVARHGVPGRISSKSSPEGTTQPLMAAFLSKPPFPSASSSRSKVTFCLPKSCSIATCRARLNVLSAHEFIRTIPNSGRDRQPTHAFDPYAKRFQGRPGERHTLFALLAVFAHFFLPRHRTNLVETFATDTPPDWMGAIRRMRRLRRNFHPYGA